jgi:excisionase family DNA binding protein
VEASRVTGTNGTTGTVTLGLPEELLETIAQRAAVILAAQAPSADQGYLDVTGAADFLACPPSRIYALVSARRIPHHRDGSRLLFDRQELRDYVSGGGARRP